MSCFIPPQPSFKPGDIVRLIPSGPPMLVIGVGVNKRTGERAVGVRRFDAITSSIHYELYPPTQLEKVGQ